MPNSQAIREVIVHVRRRVMFQSYISWGLLCLLRESWAQARMFMASLKRKQFPSNVVFLGLLEQEISETLQTTREWFASNADLQRCQTSKSREKEQYLVYLAAYRTALSETDVSKLESEWTEVDQKWMDIRHWVQMYASLFLLNMHWSDHTWPKD